ncbi:MAG: chemotaxis protein CheD [Candidatus Caenarcaniphilales bacterium]|nr:chemotaxis protein CheD [Candidatus Caenarcaniphilales bacterium]
MIEQSKTEIRLNMGQWFVSSSDHHKLIAPSLGSCVALCLYDKSNKIGGMAHVVLPSRVLRDIKTSSLQSESYPCAKYADESILLLLNEIKRQAGHSALSLKAKLAGGSQMFVGTQKRKSSDELRPAKEKPGFPLIGRSNCEVLKKELKKFSIPIINSDLGGNWGRTVSFNSTTGEVKIRRIGSSEEVSI